MSELHLPELSPDDELVLELLQGLSRRAQSATRALWQLEREGPAEDLLSFLVRLRIFGAGAGGTLRLIRKGYARFEDASPLLAPQGRERLSELCSTVGETRSSCTPRDPEFGRLEAPRSSLPEVGDRLGRCLLTDRIGRGGTCTVYRALHLALQIPVAVKVLDRSQLNELDWERSRGEARLLARLNHPNILRILDFEDQGPNPYLVLEHIEGFSLHELIRQSGTIKPHRAVHLLAQLVDALQHALDHGIIHRDLKPANVLLDKVGVPHLADLGIATIVGEKSDEGGIVGTPAYLAPERIRGEPADHRSDIYSLGVCLFEMLTGRLPFEASRPLGFLTKHLEEAAPAPHVVAPGVPQELSQLVLKILSKSPGDRPQTYDELAGDLAAFKKGSTQSDRHAITTEQTSGFWRALSSVFRREEES